MQYYPYGFFRQYQRKIPSPSSIAGLQLWLESSTNITLNSGNVSSWVEKTQSINYAQGTALNQPPYLTNEVNGLQALNFTGSPITLAGGSTNLLNNATGATLFAVVKANAIPGTSSVIFYISSGTAIGSSRFALQLISTQRFQIAGRRMDGDSLSTFPSNSAFSLTNYQIVCVQYDVVTRTVSFYINNPNTADATSTAFGTVGSNFSATNSLGTNLASANASTFANTRIADTLLFNRSLTLTERQNIFNYLNARFRVY
jgi:hypothetical protein